ncbi:hypothetical protein T4C_9843 [Trichinella pseudospiralis]|uniref:Uncharacterized protein n=1 Tax=Trichinella pseudospiralis TaxID=6337 RepID=A0A0V1HDL9_TRIPS|nr:hypothetical protein T4C_9843 [Trichinella pseudospiralis]
MKSAVFLNLVFVFALFSSNCSLTIANCLDVIQRCQGCCFLLAANLKNNK